MSKASTFVGLDVHKSSIVVALLRAGESTPLEWKVANEPGAVHRLIRKLERESEHGVQCCYANGHPNLPTRGQRNLPTLG